MGSAVSALAATGLVAIVLRNDDAERIQAEVVSAHLRSLQAGHLTDVISTDRHTVKPWFEGRLPFSFPIPELAGTPFRLLGGRVVYWRQQPGAYLLLGKGGHRLSLFVFRGDPTPRLDEGNGFNTRTWRANGLLYVNSGYSHHGGILPGNVMLAFGL